MTHTPEENTSVEDSSLDLKSLGPYTIDSRLGQGGMGIVYLATDKSLGRQVAIKVLHPHLLKHENLKQRFRREARMHAKLMHPNIVTLLSLFEDDEHMALVMECIQGDDLKVFLRKNTTLSIFEKLSIALEILKGLSAAHEFGMVHRDLKPANVIVSNKGEIKLLDFGLAKPETGSDDLTQSGATVGSFRYMAPEQILNNPIDARTDLYAFGILLFYMLVGKLPFDATNNGGEFEIMEKQVRDPAPSPHELNSNIPLPLSHLILKLLEKNKIHRHKDAATVRLEIEKIQAELHVSKAKNKRAGQSRVDITPLPLSTLSNGEIAMQWINLGQRQSQKLWKKAQALLKKPYANLMAVAFVFILLGFSSISALSMAENTVAQTSIEPHENNIEKVSPSPVPTPKATPVVKVKPKPAVTPAKKTVKKVVKVAPKPQPKKPKPRVTKSPVLSATFNTPHTVKRSDKSKVDSKKKHEFRGGSHLFYPKLAKKGWLNSFKRGESVVEFETPISLSKIILHKASVGRLDFKRGFVQLEAKAPNSYKWVKLFERKDDDVDIKVTLKNIKQQIPLIQSIRIKFKTADPITIGPIDLIR